ncbi:MAG: exodeoxyribonuclease V subunit beta [Spirochaetes bacterium]|nr:exodeoxyribonuclease V subunit beta [Spirochaetota bacterium]
MKPQVFDLIKSPIQGTNLIEASAGTGKTYNIAGLFLRLILEKKIEIDKILAVTYTEAATEELRIRIRTRLRQALKVLLDEKADTGNDDLIEWVAANFRGNETAAWYIKDALSRFDEASICTIHGFCRRMLTENAFESNSLFDAELITDQSDLERGIVYDFWRMNFYSASGMLIQYADKINVTPSHFLSLKELYSIDPNFKVIPELERQDVSENEQAILISYKKLKAKWETSRPEVEDIIFDFEGLNRSKYRNPQNLIDEMNIYIESDNPVLIFDKFEKFTFPVIQSSLKKGFDPPEHEFFDFCSEYMQVYQRTVSVFDRYIQYIETQFFKFLKEESVIRKQKLNCMGFDDLLINMHDAIAMDPDSRLARAIRQRYSAALIDEFQDTDPVQYDIFRTIFGYGKSILFLIGDPKQSIYKFRGADIFAYINALRNIDNRYTLLKNWRSSPDLIKAVNTIFKNKEHPFVFNEIEFSEAESGRDNDSDSQVKSGTGEKSFQLWIIGKEHADQKNDTIGKSRAVSLISRSVAGEIYRLVKPGKEGRFRIKDTDLRPGHIAVLVRKKRQASIIQQELYQYNIPSVLYGSESIFRSHEAMEIERLAASVADPGDEKRFKRALATDIFAFTGKDILNLMEDENTWEQYLTRFYEYHNEWAKYGFFSMFMSLLTKENVREKLLSYADGERRMTNITHLAELMHHAETEKNLRMESLVKWIEEKRADTEDGDELQIRLETDEDAVKLITIHRSKGLEFPVVFCPFTWEGSDISPKKYFSFHDPDRDYKLTLDLERNDDNRHAAETEELAENLRLLYVALTRASYRCYLFTGKINETGTSSLSYLFHQKNENTSADLVVNLKLEAEELSYDSMVNDISKFEKLSENTIEVRSMSFQEYAGLKPDRENIDDIQCRLFSGTISRNWRISSFSALTGNHHEYYEAPDYDRADLNRQPPHTENEEEQNIFAFPKGAVTGTCFHEIFEKLDFTDYGSRNSAELVEQTLAKYNFGSEWMNPVNKMISGVLEAQLMPDSGELRLKDIPNDFRLNELEFNMPLDLISSDGLAGIFRNYNSDDLNNFSQLLERLGFRPHRGMLKGFIDMIFEHNGRFYIIDWKSNYLGSKFSDYSPDLVKNSMKDNLYILQYYIYTVALNRMLIKRKPDYNYTIHFGGVFYLFVRGVDPAYPGAGIFYDCPSEEIITSLDAYFSTKG